MDASWWNRTYADAVLGLREIAGTGVRVAVVSNADGTAADLLRNAEICQVGEGAGVRIDAVVDSYLVGVEKPDPRIFEIALTEIGVPADRALHIGDTLWADVRGAEAAGVRPVHFDPYGDCREPDGHEHVRSLREVPALLR
jgi:putative hydrolase of the HAD superfamily